MREPHRWPSSPALALVAIALAGCNLDPQAPRPAASGAAPSTRPAPGRLTLQTDVQVLESRVRRLHRALVVRPPAAPSAAARDVAPKPAATLRPLGTQLELVAEISPPVVDGHLVQANDIDLDPLSRTAVVGYNMAGDVFAGALQVVDFRTADRPQLVAEVLFHDADVNAVLKQGIYLYAGLACGDPGLASPALIEEFRFATAGFVPTGRWRDLPSWAVTDLAGSAGALAVAVGARDGGILHLDRTTLQTLAFAPEPDARAVAFGAAGDVLATCGGAAGFVRRALPDLQLRARSPLTGYGFEAAKGTLETAGAYCYLGAGDGGFQVRNQDGALLDRLANRDLAAGEPGLAVTNAVSVRGNLAFVAAGALGVQVVDLGRWSATTPVDSSGGLEVRGEIDFGGPVSSNMVKSRSNVLVVAAGLGGVKFVRMQDSPSAGESP